MNPFCPVASMNTMNPITGIGKKMLASGIDGSKKLHFAELCLRGLRLRIRLGKWGLLYASCK